MTVNRDCSALLLSTIALFGLALVDAQGAEPRHVGQGAKSSFVASIDSGGSAPPLAKGARNAAVVRAQILLDRANFTSGEIDGAFGSSIPAGRSKPASS